MKVCDMCKVKVTNSSLLCIPGPSRLIGCPSTLTHTCKNWLKRPFNFMKMSLYAIVWLKTVHFIRISTLHDRQLWTLLKNKLNTKTHRMFFPMLRKNRHFRLVKWLDCLEWFLSLISTVKICCQERFWKICYFNVIFNRIFSRI